MKLINKPQTSASAAVLTLSWNKTFVFAVFLLTAAIEQRPMMLQEVPLEEKTQRQNCFRKWITSCDA